MSFCDLIHLIPRLEHCRLPANLRSGGAYDIVCWAVVGLMFPGLEANRDYQRDSTRRKRPERPTFFIALLGRLVNYSAVFKAPEIEHSHATVSAAADKDIDAVRAEADVKNFLVMSDQLSLCR